VPRNHSLRPHDYQCRFPILPNHPQTDPKYSISICQFWSLNATFEHGQLLTQGGILQGNLFLAAENENNETD